MHRKQDWTTGNDAFCTLDYFAGWKINAYVFNKKPIWFVLAICLASTASLSAMGIGRAVQKNVLRRRRM